MPGSGSHPTWARTPIRLRLESHPPISPPLAERADESADQSSGTRPSIPRRVQLPVRRASSECVAACLIRCVLFDSEFTKPWTTEAMLYTLPDASTHVGTRPETRRRGSGAPPALRRHVSALDPPRHAPLGVCGRQ